MFDRNYEKKKVTDDPGAITPLTISGVQVTGPGIVGPNHQWNVKWTTSAPATSRVQWGQAPNRDQTTAESNTSPLVLSHTVVVSIPTVQCVGQVILFRIHTRMQGGADGMNSSVLDGYDFSTDGSFVAS